MLLPKLKQLPLALLPLKELNPQELENVNLVMVAATHIKSQFFFHGALSQFAHNPTDHDEHALAEQLEAERLGYA